MKQKLSSLKAPALAGAVREKNVRSAIAEIKNFFVDGASMIDLHLSCLESTETDELRKIMVSARLPILALNYNKTYAWDNAGFTEEERVASLIRAVNEEIFYFGNSGANVFFAYSSRKCRGF